MQRALPKANTTARWLGAAMALVLGAALAQGYPGGHGGHAGRGGGDHRAPSATGAAAETLRVDPLSAWLADLHALRMDLLVQPRQLDAWTAMQEALRDAVELEQQRAARAPPDASDPLGVLQLRADDARERADALARVDARTRALVETLDERQRRTFVERLAAIFAGQVATPVR